MRLQQVDLKIISGDNPVTVSNIAAKAGFENFESYVDCSQISDQKLRAIAEKTAIFGRVSPHQKKLIVTTLLKKKGRTVAMTGDGVNDILALREADVSMVMAEGDAATRQIANLVLPIQILTIFQKFYLKVAVSSTISLELHRFSSLKRFIRSCNNLYCKFSFWRRHVDDFPIVQFRSQWSTKSSKASLHLF